MYSQLKALSLIGLFISGISLGYAAGMVPQSSIVIIEEKDGEGSIEVKNTDEFPNLLVTKIVNIDEDKDELITVFPPVARVEANDIQTVRFLVSAQEPIKTERLKRAIFEGVPPKNRELNKEVNVTFTQNLPVLIRPAGLAKNLTPWEGLEWKIKGENLIVTNPSPYVVRFISPNVELLSSKKIAMLPQSYILPNQTLTLNNIKVAPTEIVKTVRFYPATTWGFSPNKHYDANL